MQQPEHQQQRMQQQAAAPQHSATYDNQVWTEYQDDLGRVYVGISHLGALLLADMSLAAQVLPQRVDQRDTVGPAPCCAALVMVCVAMMWRALAARTRAARDM
jgi:hypothetical protein